MSFIHPHKIPVGVLAYSKGCGVDMLVLFLLPVVPGPSLVLRVLNFGWQQYWKWVVTSLLTNFPTHLVLCEQYQHYVFIVLWVAGKERGTVAALAAGAANKVVVHTLASGFSYYYRFSDILLPYLLEPSHSSSKWTLLLLLSFIKDLSSLSLSVLFIIDWVDVPLLSSDMEFLLLKMLATLFLGILRVWADHSIFCTLRYVYTHPPEMCVLQSLF